MYFFLHNPKAGKDTPIFLIQYLKSERKKLKYLTGQKNGSHSFYGDYANFKKINMMETLALNIKKILQKSISNYARMGIDIEILEIEKNTVKVKISQNRLVNGYILNQKMLVERVKEVFGPTKLKTIVIPLVYSLDVNIVSLEWIEDKMQEFGIKRKDILKQLAIDKSSLNLYLSGERKMNKLVKSAFYFYFLTYELNRDFRK